MTELVGSSLTPARRSNLPGHYIAALRAIEEFESYYSLSQWPDGWTCEQVSIDPEVVPELVDSGLIEIRTPDRYSTTTLGRTISLQVSGDS